MVLSILRYPDELRDPKPYFEGINTDRPRLGGNDAALPSQSNAAVEDLFVPIHQIA